MKRYRILQFDFDARVRSLADHIDDNWADEIKTMHYENRKNTEQNLIKEFGELNYEQKKINFIELDAKPFSIIAFHNNFFNQIRTAFVVGSYYPALTAACALGERILNHLLLTLRDDFKSTPEYKKIYRKDSFDDWDVPINVLASWEVLLPKAKEEFIRLKDIRNKAIHFRPETDQNDRNLSLEAINCLRNIIAEQFSSFGTQPWFITSTRGESYIKKDWETKPFIEKIYLPNCLYVGPNNIIEKMFPEVIVNDNFKYEDKIIKDEEFVSLRNEFQKRS